MHSVSIRSCAYNEAERVQEALRRPNAWKEYVWFNKTYLTSDRPLDRGSGSAKEHETSCHSTFWIVWIVGNGSQTWRILRRYEPQLVFCARMTHFKVPCMFQRSWNECMAQILVCCIWDGFTGQFPFARARAPSMTNRDILAVFSGPRWSRIGCKTSRHHISAMPSSLWL